MPAKRSCKFGGPTSDADLLDAWLANQQLERLQNYLQRGRPLADASLEELRTRWIGLMRAWAESPNQVAHGEREDIEAEMQLRKVPPPSDGATSAIEKLNRKPKEAMDELLRDPIRFREMEDDLAEKTEQFKTAAKGAKS
jgi:hypothetical protein